MAKFNAAIVGVGYTTYSKASGKSVLALAMEACKSAMDDAGMGPEDVDGIVEFNVNDSVPTEAVATALALPQLNYAMDYFAGGMAPCLLASTAAMAVDTGMAKSVLLYRAMNGRSGFRLGGTGKITDVMPPRGGSQYRMPYGWLTFGENMAMWCRRHMEIFGTTNEHLGAIAITQRENALLNERATMRKPLDMEQYLASRTIAEPLHLFDMCLESDGACAVLITSGDRAKDCRKKPVNIKSGAFYQNSGTGDTMYADALLWDDLTVNFTAKIAPKLYQEAGLSGPGDVDIAEIYDCFTHTVLMGLEGLGFCKHGEGGPFAASGAIKRDGVIPINTQGGMLSEAYIHGVNVIAEAVEQLRGESGERQIKDAEVAVVTSGATTMGSGMILTV